MSAAGSHRLNGLEPDNLLAFLALLGLLRALEFRDAKRRNAELLCPRAAWDLDTLPLRPRLVVARRATPEEISNEAAKGVAKLAELHKFADQEDLNFLRSECRDLLRSEAEASGVAKRGRADVLAALMTDGAIKVDKKGVIDPTPLCLLFGQGHQHFLERFASVPAQPAPPPKGKSARAIAASECIAQALFSEWRREDDAASFRWDPEEDVRYALMAGDPTDGAYKSGTQHGANRLAAIGVTSLTLAPERRSGRVRPAVVGGASDSEGFSFAWPIWREAASLAAVRSMLAHPALRRRGALEHLGVENVMVARRISVGKFMNFSRARSL